MKYICLFLAVFLFHSCSPRLTQTQQQYLVDLLARKDYFKLQERMDKQGKGLPKVQRLYYQAFLENAFNHPRLSSEYCNKLLQRKQQATGGHTASNLLTLQIDNFAKAFQYQEAHAVSQRLLTEYSGTLDSSYQASIANSDIIWAALADTKPQKILFEGETRVPWKYDKMGLMRIPARFGLATHDFVFDTGANLSTVSVSYAKKLGIKALSGSFEVGSSTGQMVDSQVGVAESFRIGNMLLQNVVFLILPDEALSFPQYQYELNGIIGFPVIEQMREVRIHQNGQLTIPQAPVYRNLHNLALNELMPMVSLPTNRGTLVFQLDTGAKQTALFAPFFQRYQAEFEQQGIADTIRVGGAGGMVSLPVYQLDSLQFQIGDQQTTLRNLKVQTQAIDYFNAILDGNIGQDIISQFDEMILNFEHMYLYLQDDK